MTVRKYLKGEKEVEAMQVLGSTIGGVFDWLRREGLAVAIVNDFNSGYKGLEYDLNDKTYKVPLGDWLIKYDINKFWNCPQNVFHRNFVAKN